MASRDLPEVDGFTVHRVLGRGGFATVYLATQDRLRRQVALKVIRLESADLGARRRFERECETIASLTGHPSVMTVFDVGSTRAGDPYLALEYLSGGAVQDRLEEHGPAPWNEVVEIGRSVASALGAAHELGILHRDVKPANVLTDRFGNYKLGDFGIASLIGPTGQTSRGVTTLTVAYASPEVLKGERSSTASDLYGLGALMYALLSGRPAFAGATDESVLPLILRITTEDPAPLPPEVATPAVADLVARLLAKDPADRPPSAAEVVDALAAMAQGDTGAPTAPATPAPPPVGLHPTVPLVGGEPHPPVLPSAIQSGEVTRLAPGADPGAIYPVTGPTQVRPTPPAVATQPPGVGAPTGGTTPSPGAGTPPPGGLGSPISSPPTPREPRPSSKRRDLTVVAVIAVVGLAVMAIALFVGLTAGDGGDDPELTVLDYIGRDEEDAAAALRDEGLIVSSTEVDSDEPAGTVVDIDPDPGTVVSEGSRVVLEVSNGEGDSEPEPSEPGTTSGP